MELLKEEIKRKMKKRQIKVETVENISAVFSFTEELTIFKRDGEITREDLEKLIENLESGFSNAKQTETNTNN